MSCSYLTIYTTTFFCFFQAEDGIRVIGVTGVQTCALPISVVCDRDAVPAHPDHRRVHDSVDLEPDQVAVGRHLPDGLLGRSEERRVGKECRSRWSPYH